MEFLSIEDFRIVTKKTLNLLRKYQIRTATDFLKAKTQRLSSIMSAPIGIIEEYKKSLLHHKCMPQVKLLTQVYGVWNANWLPYDVTAIDDCDGFVEMCAANHFGPGSIWEICGRSAIGKTQFCHKFLMHFVSKEQSMALYIDTKMDFSPARIRAMLVATTAICQRPSNDYKKIMQRIKVIRILTAVDIIDTLQKLIHHCNVLSASASLWSSDATVAFPKLIIIDSIPAIFLNSDYTHYKERFKRQQLLAQLVRLIQELSSKYLITFILVNLSVLKTASEWDGRGDNGLRIGEKVEHCLSFGRTSCWNILPHVRLSIELTVAAEKNQSMHWRCMRVLKSCYSATNTSCTMRLF